MVEYPAKHNCKSEVYGEFAPAVYQHLLKEDGYCDLLYIFFSVFMFVVVTLSCLVILFVVAS